MQRNVGVSNKEMPPLARGTQTKRCLALHVQQIAWDAAGCVAKRLIAMKVQFRRARGSLSLFF